MNYGLIRNPVSHLFQSDNALFLRELPNVA